MFDPTVGPLVKLWKIGSDGAHVPKPREIESTLRLIGWRNVALDETTGTVSFLRPGVMLDFGAILKGFSAVEAGRALDARGVEHAVVDIGGSVMTVGSRPDGSPWRIGIQTPGAPPGVFLGVVQVQNEAVNTSGSYEKFFAQNGHRYQHIFDPHTGFPVESGVESVSVITNRLHNADGPTLAILALGVEKGLALAKRIGVDAIIIDDDRKIHLTPGLRGRFSLSDSNYSMAGR